MPSPPSSASDITVLLQELRAGAPDAAEQLAARVYDELHRIAEGAMRRERPGHTLQPTLLVSEAFLRLVGERDTAWQNRAHFFAIASQTIRRILVDHARARQRVKRDFGMRVTLDKQNEYARELVERLRGYVGNELADALLSADQTPLHSTTS